MFNMNDNSSSMSYSNANAGTGIEVRPLMRLVYLWMGLGLGLTAIIAAVLANAIAADPAGLGQTLFSLRFPIIIGQLILVFGLSWAINRISPTIALVLFFTYAASMGVTMSVIIFAVAAMDGGITAIASAFFTTAGLFGAMTVVGFTTKVDLDKYSTYFMMALIGLVIAVFVNMLLQSSMLSMVISVFGVLLFTGLTAWDTQKLKNMSHHPDFQQHSDNLVRMSVIGALMLYLDFINLFLFLLQIFAGGRD